MRYYVELCVNHLDIGMLQAAHSFDPVILYMFLADDDCLVVEI